MTVHHIDMQDARAATFYSFNLFAETRKVCGQNRWRYINFPVVEHYLIAGQRFCLLSSGVLGVGRGATGRRFSFGLLAGRGVLLSPLFEFARGGVVFEF